VTQAVSEDGAFNAASADAAQWLMRLIANATGREPSWAGGRVAWLPSGTAVSVTFTIGLKPEARA